MTRPVRDARLGDEMTSRSDIAEWFDEAPEGQTHMIVWCDTFNYEDYPEYIRMTSHDAEEYVGFNDGRNMKKLMEVYNLGLDKNLQLNRPRVYNY